ncbi:hypothetical protein DFJ73DRAFT_842085 [Zopfochytrium polystomum]|nr:hypothetical protein DFJ73DRAFT_842085 [Zopfochytrium polystomum]
MSSPSSWAAIAALVAVGGQGARNGDDDNDDGDAPAAFALPLLALLALLPLALLALSALAPVVANHRRRQLLLRKRKNHRSFRDWWRQDASDPSETAPLLPSAAAHAAHPARAHASSVSSADLDDIDDIEDFNRHWSGWEFDDETAVGGAAVDAGRVFLRVHRAIALAVPTISSAVLFLCALLAGSSSALLGIYGFQLLLAPLILAAVVVGTTLDESQPVPSVRWELEKRFGKRIVRSLSFFYFVYGICASSVLLIPVFAGESPLPVGLFAAQGLAALTAGAFLGAAAARVPLSPIRRKLIDGKKPSPELEASFLSILTFSWFNAIMAHGNKHDMKLEDLWSVNPSEHIENNLALISKLRRQHPSWSLFYLIFLFNRKTMIKQAGFLAGSTALFFSGPFFLNRILNYIDHRADPNPYPAWIAYSYVVGMLLASIARYALDGQVANLARKIGIRTANILSGLIYRKALRRSPQVALKDDERSASVGKIVSLMQVDSSTVGMWIGLFYSPAVLLVQIIIAVGALMYILGWAAVAGVTVLVVLMFSGAPLAGMLRSRQKAVKQYRDSRVNAFNEFLQGIKIVKLFAWENRFEKKIDTLREQELKGIFETKILGAMNRVLWFSAPLLTTFITLFTYTVVMGYQLNATVAFTALSLFNLLRNPLQFFPDTLVQLIDTWVSFQRIDLFLQEEELEDLTNPSANTATDSNPAISLGFEDASFEWSLGSKRRQEPVRPKLFSTAWFKSPSALTAAALADPASTEEAEQENLFRLSDLNGQFPQSKLSVIIGATGAGKSSLFLALLGEMRRTHGRRSCPVDPSVSNGSTPSIDESIGIAYVPQVPWLLNATVRDNILFGKAYDPERYQRVLEACALVKDLETLDGGDLTEVGEKGINLSGGQKQRISLARAAYSDSPWVLLDDPLSAVDAPTARHIYEHCILGLLANRTRLLVTNAVGLAIPRADFVVLIHSGRVASQGSVEHVLSELTSCEVPPTPFGDSIIEASDVIMAERAKYGFTGAGIDGDVDVIKPVSDSTKADGKAALTTAEDEAKKRKSKLVQDETMAKGKVSFAVYYLYYCALGGLPYLAILVAGYCANIGLTVYMDIIVAHWTESYEKLVALAAAVSRAWSVGDILPPFDLFDADHTPLVTTFKSSVLLNGTEPSIPEEDPTSYYLKYYALFALLTIIAIIVRLVILAYIQQRAGRSIHKRMLGSILGSPLRFFEVTPLGRIVNRFSKDLSSLDFEVGPSAGNMMYQMIMLLFVVGTISSVVPPLLLLLPPLGYIYSLIGMYYIRTSRSLKRIDSVSRSPIFSHFGETLAGVTVIRAFHGSSRRFNDSNRATYSLSVSNAWFTLRMQVLSSTVMFAAGVLVIVTGVNASVAGLCLNLTLQLSEALIAIVRNQSWLEMTMNAVERCDEYLKLEQEASPIVPNSRPPARWPQTGQISIHDLEMRYSKDTPLVLHGISAEILPREKVGIVGRTGAGKSTLTLALFRIIEPAGGTVIIDGVDIRSIGLEDLRSNLTIIPQDPVLFAGTVRSNLDPFDNLDDATLWNALRRAHLVAQPSASIPSETASVHSAGEASGGEGAGAKKHRQNEFKITLETPIAEGGSNLSAGQRQLLCLARALARACRVIVLDEATASVDTETDSRIQETIRSELTQSTVLTIAHRLKTIVDCMVESLKNDSPHRLIHESKVGEFRRMCMESGEFDELVSIARAAHTKKWGTPLSD